jgi:prepilin-type N-terminal cleavage/methylation domain-containing protein
MAAFFFHVSVLMSLPVLLTLCVNSSIGICHFHTGTSLEVFDYSFNCEVETELQQWRLPRLGVLDMDKKKGFSLLELLLVVAIILIVATIAVPALLRSRQSANETAAVSNLRLVNSAETSYTVSGGGNYGTVPELVTAGLLDSRFLGVVSGYNFSIAASGNDYTASAVVRGVNDGRYDFFTRPDNVIRYSTDSTRAPLGLSGEPVR